MKTVYEFAQRFVGEVVEIPGEQHAPFIQWCFECCGYGPETPDEVPWCSAFVNRIAWLLRLPRSKSAAARSWLEVGVPVALDAAQVGDVVVLWRGDPTSESGHVGLYAGHDKTSVQILGGNQSNGVSVAPYPLDRVLGVRRLA